MKFVGPSLQNVEDHGKRRQRSVIRGTPRAVMVMREYHSLWPKHTTESDVVFILLSCNESPTNEGSLDKEGRTFKMIP